MSNNPFSDQSGFNPYQTPLPGGQPGVAVGAAQAKVQPAAMTLLISSIVFLVIRGFVLIFSVFGLSFVAAQPGIGGGAAQGGNTDATMAVAQLISGIVGNMIVLICGIVVVMGALKMRQLQSRSLAMAAAIMSMIPCTSPCCLIGLPVGIWCLVVLNDPAVKSVYR